VPPTVGIALAGDSRRKDAWSGTPRSIADGLERTGVTVTHLQALAPPLIHNGAKRLLGAVRRDETPLDLTREIAALRTAALRVRLRRAGPLERILQIGSDFSVPSRIPVVTYEDMTIDQAVRDYPLWQRMPPGALRARRELQRMNYVRAMACCTTTTWVADSIVNDYGIPRDKVHAVGVGRNHDPRPVERDWRRPRFLFVGKDWERKNGPRVVRAFAEVRAVHPEATLDVVGSHPRLDAAGVTGHGFLRLDDAGDWAELERLYENATCFVMPSVHEPSAIAYTEAAAAGLPSIGTTKGGSAQLIGNGGVVVDPFSDAEIVDAMMRFAHAAEAEAAGGRGRARSALFTWDAVAQRIVRVFALDGVAVEGFAEDL
jgi:glycosyltransferase involved in cell wall biosynthesis